MYEPISATEWKQLKNDKGEPVPRPQKVVSGFAINSAGLFPILYRTKNVRSAPECWSLPSGLHEIGLTYAQQFSNELEEELGLITIKGPLGDPAYLHVGSYENILPLENWHWCIEVMAVLVEDSIPINREPEKHNPIELVDLQTGLEKLELGAHATLATWVTTHKKEIEAICQFLLASQK